MIQIHHHACPRLLLPGDCSPSPTVLPAPPSCHSRNPPPVMPAVLSGNPSSFLSPHNAQRGRHLQPNQRRPGLCPCPRMPALTKIPPSCPPPRHPFPSPSPPPSPEGRGRKKNTRSPSYPSSLSCPSPLSSDCSSRGIVAHPPLSRPPPSCHARSFKRESIVFSFPLTTPNVAAT